MNYSLCWIKSFLIREKKRENQSANQSIYESARRQTKTLLSDQIQTDRDTETQYHDTDEFPIH